MKLNYRRTMLVGLAFMSICSFWSMFDLVIPKMLKNTFDLKDTATGVVMALDNILALVLLPLFGALSDRLNSPFGRRIPYIFVGTALAAGSMLLLPIAASNKSLVLFFIVLGVVLLSMSSYRSPAVALMPDITPKPLRSKGNAIINIMGVVGGIIALALIRLLVPAASETPDYLPLFAALAFVMLLCICVLVLTVREPQWAADMQRQSAALPEEHAPSTGGAKLGSAERLSLALILLSVFLWFMGYNAVQTAISRYADVAWGVGEKQLAIPLGAAQITALLSFFPMSLLTARIGRRKSILIGIITLTSAFALCIFLRSYSWLVTALFAIAGIGWAIINVNSYPMVVEMCKESDIGKYTGYYYTFSMTAQILTPILSGYMLEHVGYNVLFPYSVLFVALSFLTMYRVRHGDSRPVPKASRLEAFDVD